MHPARIIIGVTLHEVESTEIDWAVINDIKDIHRLTLEKFGMGVKPKL